MTQKQLIYNQILGKIKMSRYFKFYITYCWHFATKIIEELTDEEDYEVSGRYTKSGNPLIIEVGKE